VSHETSVTTYMYSTNWLYMIYVIQVSKYTASLFQSMWFQDALINKTVLNLREKCCGEYSYQISTLWNLGTNHQTTIKNCHKSKLNLKCYQHYEIQKSLQVNICTQTWRSFWHSNFTSLYLTFYSLSIHTIWADQNQVLTKHFFHVIEISIK
jgi:hypothetical protein